MLKIPILAVLTILFFAFGCVAQKPQAPLVRAVDITGKAFNSGESKGKVIIYNFWYIGCPPCMEEIPKLNKIVEKYKDKDVVFIAMATNKKSELTPFLKKHPFEYRIVSDAAPLMLGSYGERDSNGTLNLKFPTHVIVGKDGLVESKTTGLKGVEMIEQYLAKQFSK